MNVSVSNFNWALLVEDEVNLASALQIALKKLKIPAKHVSTIEAARNAIKSRAPDLLVLDRTLPDGDGLALCEELRGSGFRGAVLMLTARGQTQERIDGLRKGADDYLPKPFSWDELGARIEALSRRFTPSEKDSTGVWAADRGKLRIKGPSGWTTLTPLEFKLAKHLMDADGAIVSRETLLKSVWGFTLLPKTRTVDHFMGRLRKLFEENPEEPKHFVTVRGAGYRFQK